MQNLFASLPRDLSQEVFEDILKTDQLRIERIVSKGHSSPDSGWWDQDENEWVLVLEGEALVLLEEDQRQIQLSRGDHLNIPAHCRHRVLWTDPERPTIWLAVFYR